MSSNLADIVLAIHFLFVLFVVGGLPAIWIGAARGWLWVRNVRFRIAHLGAILFVTLEALLGIACPLTLWEDELRGDVGSTGFMARWLRRLLFYNLPEWAFICAYIAFALLVALTWRRIPPLHRRPNRWDI
ncbi:MAG: putative rane protein [Betaproteobacteria bacterium]|nr:putative rane protein [Betaproteobacteria bacterium]